MKEYARFAIGSTGPAYVVFTPRPSDVARMNYNGVTCYYRSGAWYVPKYKGLPAENSSADICWGIPETSTAALLSPEAGAFAFKADGGKPNWFLLMSGKGCAAALAGVVRVLSFAVRPVAEGGKGYTEHSWRQVPNARERYEAAMYRHLNKIALGEDVDDESGESHWDHVATNALFLSELTKAGM